MVKYLAQFSRVNGQIFPALMVKYFPPKWWRCNAIYWKVYKDRNLAYVLAYNVTYFLEYIIGMSSELYNRIQSITDNAQKRKAIKSLSEAEKKSYVRYQTNLRQRKYMSNPVNRTLAYVLNAEYKKMIKVLHPNKARQNRTKHAEYMRAYRQARRHRWRCNVNISLRTWP